MLHNQEDSVTKSPSDAPAAETSALTSSQSLTHCSVNERSTTVLLQTVVLKVVDSNGQPQLVRALLDSASQLNIVSSRLIQRLRIPRQREHHSIGGIGQSATVSKHAVHLVLQSRNSDYTTTAKFRILNQVTRDLPVFKVNTSKWKMPEHIDLADPSFYEPGPIDLIIGVELYFDIVEEGLTKLPYGKLALQNTVFGWVVAGRVAVDNPSTDTSIAMHINSSTIEEQLGKFWELETCRSTSILSVEESVCEKQFTDTTVRNADGRFIVQLPKRKEKLSLLGNSKEIAIRRFQSLERRLSSNPTLKTAYSEFIHEYIQLNHMSEVSDQTTDESSCCYYLPHHCVVRPDSTTTKLRVVFDASCASDSGVSLNDALMIGPTLQDDLLSILLRFRTPKFVMIADIEKMYRQILVSPVDRPLQRIIWRDSTTERLRTFQLNTVTYGTSCAPYLATKSLQVLAEHGATTHPEAAVILKRDFYMDDMLTGVDNIKEGQTVCQQLNDLLSTGGFCLRKWATNCQAIFQHLPHHLQDERNVYNLDSKTAIIKTLGLKYHPSDDVFLFDVPKWVTADSISKRIAVSDSAKLFDPLGLVGPVIVLAKMFLQELWMLQLTWDEPLDQELQGRWLTFREQLTSLKSLKIQRRVLTNKLGSVQMHCFCDASE